VIEPSVPEECVRERVRCILQNLPKPTTSDLDNALRVEEIRERRRTGREMSARERLAFVYGYFERRT
jgi:hypothetical protein